MASRAYWKGHLRLSLVTVGIELHSAIKSSASIALHQIHKPSGKRIRTARGRFNQVYTAPHA